jgi:pyruvate/2-oxoglutarate dehydrogenase complex dihydrolipoamide acyltransferase (E2) component
MAQAGLTMAQTTAQDIAEIETDKANMAYEADVAGTLLEILAPEGEVAAVGAVIARIGDPRLASLAAAPPQPSRRRRWSYTQLRRRPLPLGVVPPRRQTEVAGASRLPHSPAALPVRLGSS